MMISLIGDTSDLLPALGKAMLVWHLYAGIP
jgi:hypothetical protein